LSAPIIAPVDRVREAIAPSTVMRFSSLRLPLMLKLPVVRLSPRYVLAALPVRTPALSIARLIGLRPFSARSWTSFNSIVLRFCVSNCSGVDFATTVTISLTADGLIVASSVSLAAASSRTFFCDHFLNPVSSTSTS